MPRRFFTVFAWLLVALWLPASLHCAAESAGWFDEVDCCAHADLPLAADSASADHCEILAAGAPREDLAPAGVALPPGCLPRLLQVIAAAARLDSAAPEVTPTEAPRHVLTEWARVRRLVAPARAP